MNNRGWPVSAYDADFTDGQAETSVPFGTTSSGVSATYATVDVTGANVWLAVNTSSGSLTLSTTPENKAVLILKDWVLPFEIPIRGTDGRGGMTHFKFKPVAGAAGHITINFYR